MLKVIIRDIRARQNYYLNLSNEQYRLLLWLDNNDMLRSTEVEVYENYEFKGWNPTIPSSGYIDSIFLVMKKRLNLKEH